MVASEHGKSVLPSLQDLDSLVLSREWGNGGLGFRVEGVAPWFLVGNGGMGYWDCYRGPYIIRDYHRDPFSYSLLRTREPQDAVSS